MALPPTLPTSFVPRQAALSERASHTDLMGLFGILSYMLFGVVVVLAAGVFFYGRILDATQSTKEAALAKAEAAIDPATVNGFVRLRNRLNASKTLLAGHSAFSNFFTALDTLLPQSVRFSVLHVSSDLSGNTTVEGSGVAKSFNALSAASAAFGSDGRIKDVIFSKISINPNNTVSFSFSASLDPRLVAYSSSAAAAPATAAATTTP